MEVFIFREIIKIKVFASGDVFINDKKSSSVDALKAKLEEIKRLQGAVWYYRENNSNIPNEVADEVFSLLIQLKMPLSLSSKSDFSDWIDGDGVSHPRPK